jgi:hypothetical protein
MMLMPLDAFAAIAAVLCGYRASRMQVIKNLLIGEATCRR